jgi:hypothetical protein
VPASAAIIAAPTTNVHPRFIRFMSMLPKGCPGSATGILPNAPSPPGLPLFPTIPRQQSAEDPSAREESPCPCPSSP